MAQRRPRQRLALRPAGLAERLEPTFTGWQAHERPFGFEEEMDYADGAARFLTGTPNVPALYAATAGYDLIEEIGVGRIRENSLRQTQLLIELAERPVRGREPREPARRAAPSPCTCPSSRPCTRSSPSVRSSATSGPMRDPPRPPLLQL